jgi:tetratricopeptide (TPR) repeat protein
MRNFVSTILLALVLPTPLYLAQTYSKNTNAIEETRVPVSIAETDESAAGTSPSIILQHNAAVQNAMKGRIGEAITEFRRVVSAAPNLASPYYNLAISLSYLAQYEEAVIVLRKLISIKPDYPGAQATLGEILCRTDAKEEGIEKLRFALNLNASDVISTMNLGICLYEAGQYGEALKLYEKLVNQNPNLAQAHNDRGVVLLALKKFEPAFNSFQRAIEKKPDFAEPYNNHQAYLKAYKLRPDWNHAVFNLAMSFLRLKDRPAAQRLLNELRKIDADLAAKLQDKLNEKYVYKAPI